jgi:nitroreductase
MLDKKTVFLEDIAEKMEMVNNESNIFYNAETGEFAYYNEYDRDSGTDPEEYGDGEYIDLPSQYEIHEYEIMENFAETISDARKRELLTVALEGKGAFRRFKDTLHRVELADSWYKFRSRAFIRLAREWCVENEIPYKFKNPDEYSDIDESEPVFSGNGTIDAIAHRYSCRGFTKKMPSYDDLETVAKAAVAAPSGMNRQLWRVIILKNKKLIDEMEKEGMSVMASMPDKSMYERIMSRGGKLFYNAPCMAVVPIAKAEPAGAELFDCGIVAQNIALAATALGIDSLICGLAAFCFAGESGEEFKKLLNFPEGYEIGIAVLLGYAKEPGKPHAPDYDKISFIE